MGYAPLWRADRGVFVSADGKTGVRIALITVAGSVLVAVVSGIFAMVASRDGDPGRPRPRPLWQAAAPRRRRTRRRSTPPLPTRRSLRSEPPASAKVESVPVEAHDYKRVGAGLYYFSSDKLDFRYWWRN